MDMKKAALLEYGGMLYALGIELERERDDLAWLVERGVGFETAMMRLAYEDYRQTAEAFGILEKQYQALLDE